MDMQSMPYNPDEALKLDNQLCFPLYAASRKIINAYTPYLKPLGITYTQYITFMVLWEKDSIPVRELCTRLHLDNGTLTPLLKKMEEQGFITRHRDSGDERKVRIRSAAIYRVRSEAVFGSRRKKRASSTPSFTKS